MKFIRPRARFFALVCLLQIPLAWFFDDVWIADASLHFLPQQIILFVVSLLMWTMPNKKRVAVGLSVAFSVMLSLSGRLPIVHWLLDTNYPEVPTSTSDFQLITFNVLTSNPLKEDAIKWIRGNLSQATPNVVVLLETDKAWTAEADRLNDRLPYVFRHPRSDNFGMTILSSVPMTETAFTESESECLVPSFSGLVTIGTRSTRIIAVHAVPPAPDSLDVRNRCLKELERQAINGTSDAILTGDLNCSPWAKCFPRLLRDPSPFFFRKHTWETLWGIFSTPIDHVLHTGGLYASIPEVGPDLGSDHRPLTTYIWLSP